VLGLRIVASARRYVVMLSNNLSYENQWINYGTVVPDGESGLFRSLLIGIVARWQNLPVESGDLDMQHLAGKR
jgi:hypothetical protein